MSSGGIKIVPFDLSWVAGVKKLTDQEIGKNYYSLAELKDIVRRSIKNGHNTSFVLLDDAQVVGVRLTYPPGQWSQGKGQVMDKALWPFALNETAYFQSLFLKESARNQGWGTLLSQHSIQVLRDLGAKGIVCHSWVESPGDSSRCYLKKLGFETLKVWPHYWKEVDYVCPRCGKPCLCSAEEMYLTLEEK